ARQYLISRSVSNAVTIVPSVSSHSPTSRVHVSRARLCPRRDSGGFLDSAVFGVNAVSAETRALISSLVACRVVRLVGLRAGMAITLDGNFSHWEKFLRR